MVFTFPYLTLPYTREKVNDGKQLKRKRLKNDVVPSKWPGIPSYLSNETFVPRPTSTTSSTLRADAQAERDNMKYGFTTIGELKNKFDRSIFGRIMKLILYYL